MSRYDDVCPTFGDSRKCEVDTMEVMDRFKRFYEGKLREVDIEGGGDCLELKLKIQQRWIDDLTEQTEMMARIVKDLEIEAADRVQRLEEKLHQTSKCANEVMKRYHTYNFTLNLDEPFQRVGYLESDLKNLVEFVRRVRDDGQWSISGLEFYEVTFSELFGDKGPPTYRDQNVIPLTVDETTGKVGKALKVTLQFLEKAPEPEQDDNDKRAEVQEPPENVVDCPCETTKRVVKRGIICPTRDDDAEVLRLELEFYKSFGTGEEIALHKKKSAELDTVKQAMADMRSALTEEVAYKHDMISTLRKDVQKLEERCLQADKQTAFKDDIIKELRKEIKQIKQEGLKKNEKKEKEMACLKRKVDDLEQKLTDASRQLCKMKPCVDSKIACTMVDDDLSNRSKDKQVEDEIKKRQAEVDELNCKCRDLEKALLNSQKRAENLQKAVDLYLNSINVLEASEERAKIEIEQQKFTIASLQEALVGVKQELDDIKHRGQQDDSHQQFLLNILHINLLDLENRNESYRSHMEQMQTAYKKLQDSNLDLEMEHMNSLQDLTMMETQLIKYQTEFRDLEDCRGSRNDMKKLKEQKKCYEHVIDCFKQEMAVMSEQLKNLQDILNISNQSCKEESCQLYNAVRDLQKLSERLKQELKETEQQAMLGSQMNCVKDAQIDELQQIIEQKNADLQLHDEAINDLKNRLEDSILQNHELQATVVGLNSTVMQMQCNMQAQDVQHPCPCCASASASGQKNNNDRLEYDYDRQHEMLKQTKKELEKNKEKIKALKRQVKVEELKQKLTSAEGLNTRIKGELDHVQCQSECTKDQELAQFKQIILELRQTLIELDECLGDGSIVAQSAHWDLDDVTTKDQCLKYKRLLENFKNSFKTTVQKIKAFQKENKQLSREVGAKTARVAQLEKKLQRNERETCRYSRDMAERLQRAQLEEKRLLKMLAKGHDPGSPSIRPSRSERSPPRPAQGRNNPWGPPESFRPTGPASPSCSYPPYGGGPAPASPDTVTVDKHAMNATQEEINSLKIEIKNMIQNQIALNAENDKLLTELSRLQSSDSPSAEDKTRAFRDKLDRAQSEIRRLKDANRDLQGERDELADELRILQTAYSTLEKAHAQLKAMYQQLECEIRCKRDDLASESRAMLDNVQSWLEEQKRLNDHANQKARDYHATIGRLKMENNSLKSQQNGKSGSKRFPSPILKPGSCGARRPPARVSVSPDCQWNLGSQGTGSAHDSSVGSPSSGLSCSVEEWYAPNYRDEDDTDYVDEDFINKIEDLTNRLKNNNRCFAKNKCGESQVTRDEK